MTSLLTNTAAMTALTTLKSINQQLDVTSNRVSTGQRVSGASDNAAYWSIATTVRTDNASLGAVKDSLGLGSSSVDTAYNGVNSIIADLQNLRAKLQTAVTPGVDRSKVQVEIAAIQSKMKATADSSNSSGQNWLSVNSSASNKAYLATQNVVGGFARAADGTITFSKVGIDVQSIKLYDTNSTSVTTAATTAQLVGSTALTGTDAFKTGAAAGTADFSGPNEVSLTVTLAGSSQTATLTLNAASLKSVAKDLTKVTTDEFLTALNNQIAASSYVGGQVNASLDSSGRLAFTTTGTGTATTLNIKVGQSSAGKAAVDAGFGNATVASTNRSSLIAASSDFTSFDLSGSNQKEIIIGDGSITAPGTTVTLTATMFANLGSSATSASNKVVNGTDVAAMINKALADAGNKVVASFANNRLTFANANADMTKGLQLSGANLGDFGGFTAATTAATTSSGGVARDAKGSNAGSTQAQGILDTTAGTYSAGGTYSIATINIANLVGTSGDNDLAAIITAVDKAIGTVTNAATKLGANKTQIDGQKTFVDTLMKANDRTIGILVDADIEEESTKLKALQTQQQLAVQSLSIANSSSQNILSLFR